MVRINLSITEELLREVDSYRYIIKENRSAFMAQALKNYFEIIDREVLDKRRKKAIDEIKNSRKVIAEKLSGWDSTSDIRRLRESRHSG
jgi:metal-responsive CopG/Arc/MetJ family transcriptional regulator